MKKLLVGKFEEKLARYEIMKNGFYRIRQLSENSYPALVKFANDNLDKT